MDKPTYWQAIHAIIDPLDVDLNPYVEFIPNWIGFFDASKS